MPDFCVNLPVHVMSDLHERWPISDCGVRRGDISDAGRGLGCWKSIWAHSGKGLLPSVGSSKNNPLGRGVTIVPLPVRLPDLILPELSLNRDQDLSISRVILCVPIDHHGLIRIAT